MSCHECSFSAALVNPSTNQSETLPNGSMSCAEAVPSPAALDNSSPYIGSLNVSAKVLDFVQLGGPKWTIDRTIFEMRLGGLSTDRGPCPSMVA